MFMLGIDDKGAQLIPCSVCGKSSDESNVSFLETAPWVVLCRKCEGMLDRITKSTATEEDLIRIKNSALRGALDEDVAEELKAYLSEHELHDAAAYVDKCLLLASRQSGFALPDDPKLPEEENELLIERTASSASSLFQDALDAFNDEDGKISRSFGQYRVMQVVLREKFIGKGSKNFREIEDLCNQQYAEGYRLHTFAQSTAHSTGAFGGDRTVCNLVFEKMN